MIAPKVQRPTAAEERLAYEIATVRDGDLCQRCRRDCGPIARDHRKNRSQGGPTLAHNLHLLGLRCHQWATEHPLLAVAEGWAVPGWADPREWPARRWLSTMYGTHRLGWALLDDVGGWTEISEENARERMEGTAA